jgi:hypothetical protein
MISNVGSYQVFFISLFSPLDIFHSFTHQQCRALYSHHQPSAGYPNHRLAGSSQLPDRLCASPHSPAAKSFLAGQALPQAVRFLSNAQHLNPQPLALSASKMPVFLPRPPVLPRR